MSFLANLPDSILGNLVDRKWLLATLTAMVVVAMLRYLQTVLLLTIFILAIGANLPAELASALGISQLALLVSLAVIVTITLLNRVTRLLPMERESLSKALSQETIEWRQTMMSVIAEGNEAALVQMLAKDTTAVSFTEGGMTPLHLAAENGNSNIMRILISHGADFRMKNTNGMTPMEILMGKKISNQVDIPKNSNFEFLKNSGELLTKRTDAELWQEQHKPN
jgi:hypothetical protein